MDQLLLSTKRSVCYLFLVLSGSLSVLPAQNLLTDGGFESLRSNACVQPDQLFLQSSAWYPLVATPDLFINNCPIDVSGLYFWDASLKAYEGKNYAGLWSRWNSNGTYVSEGIATELAAPLVAGKEYYIELAIRSRGAYQGAVSSSNLCALVPDKHLDVYLSPDPIRLAQDTSNGTFKTEASLVAEITDRALQNNDEGEWMRLSTCFRATGGERHLALIMPLGTFGPLPVCAGQASSGVFNSFYFNIDQVNVTTLPDRLQKDTTACPEEEFTLNLLELLDFPLLKEARLVWDDGFEGSFRTVRETRTYRISAEFECGQIPIEIRVNPAVCEAKVYAATAFTPNGDGHNDTFRPLLDPEVRIDQYRFSVFNRWGNLVFRTEDPNQTWDGNSPQSPQPEGSYVWLLECQLGSGGGSQRIQESGSLTLFR